MLADDLERLEADIIRRVAEGLAANALGDPVVVGRLSEYLGELRAELRDPRTPHRMPSVPASCRNVEAASLAVRLLRDGVLDTIDERALATTTGERRLVNDWFYAMASHAWRSEHRRITALLDAVPDHLMAFSLDGRPLTMNRSGEAELTALVGVRPAEFSTRSVLDWEVMREQRKSLAELFARVTGGETIRADVFVPHADGKTRWREHFGFPLRAPDGAVEAVAFASRDIHERKVAETRLQLMSKVGELAETMEQEGVLNSVGRLAIPELGDWSVVDIVEDGQLRRGTAAHRDPDRIALVEELLRFPPMPTRFLSKKPFVLDEQELASMREQLPQLADAIERLGARSILVVPFTVLGAPVGVAAFAMTAESGRSHAPADLALAEEMARRAAQIIENARLHQQLQQSEARFRLALDHANISVFETDLELKMSWGYNSRLGMFDHEFIGKTVTDLLGDGGTELDQLERTVLETGNGASKSFSTTVDGKRRHFMVRYEVLRGVGGIVGLTGATVDVTELKEAEEQLGRELGFRERMMGILAHDMRNPVSAVLGLAGLIRRQDGVSDKAREGLGMIEHSARRMNEMIGTLLDFTRLRFQGSLPVDAREIDLDELLRGGVAELQAAYRGREITLSANGNLRGQWDPGRMAQVVSNLVANALTHGARESSVRIAVAGEGDVVHLSVSNRGPTIPPALVERLFEPFQQGADGGNGKPRGLGLGLFIVREIVRAHGGTIAVRSEDDLTTFAIKLPRTAPAS